MLVDDGSGDSVAPPDRAPAGPVVRAPEPAPEVVDNPADNLYAPAEQSGRADQPAISRSVLSRALT